MGIIWVSSCMLYFFLLSLMNSISLSLKIEQVIKIFEHMESPTWVDHMLDDWIAYQKNEISFDEIAAKGERLGFESCRK